MNMDAKQTHCSNSFRTTVAGTGLDQNQKITEVATRRVRCNFRYRAGCRLTTLNSGSTRSSHFATVVLFERLKMLPIHVCVRESSL